HGQAAGPASQEAAEQVVVAGVVPEGQGRVPGQLRRRLLMGWFIDDSRDGDSDPLLARARAAAGPLPGARAVRPGPARGVEGVAVVVAGAGVDWIGKDAVDGRGGPQPPAAAGAPPAGPPAVEDLADGHVLVDQPAVEHADDLGLGLVDQQVAGNAVALGDVAVAVGDLAGGPLPGAGLLELAAAEALAQLAQDGALVLGDGALN